MEDVLEDRRLTGDWWWVLRDWSSPTYRLKRSRSSDDIKNDVLLSSPVQHVIEQLIIETGRSRDIIEKEACKILDEMGHLFTMRAIRFFGLLLSKSMKQLYRSIDVNLEGIEAVRNIVPNFPILLVPTHRSYVDFLVVSYVFFHYNLPLPVVASGQDFMSMKVMGRLMRHAGAFFIRRSFGKDRLYWSVFAEYVQTHVVHGEAPLEFYVEGTRSRSGKSLAPKFGLLTAALEPFFKSIAPDVMVVPIAISYERTLEENLYAHELLGIPKPKESTRGLVKARQILGNNYGNIQVIFGRPISFWEFCGNKVDRSIHNHGPRHLSALTREEHVVVEELAHHILDCHQKMLVISPFSLMAAILVTRVHRDTSIIDLPKFVGDVQWLLAFVDRLGAKVNWDHNIHPLENICQSCDIHNNIVQVTDENTLIILKSQSLLSTSDSLQLKNQRLSEDFLHFAASSMLLCYYSNQILHLFVPEAIVCAAINCCAGSVVTGGWNGLSSEKESVDWIASEYKFLKELLQFEFVMFSEDSHKGVAGALVCLSEAGTVMMDAEQVTVNRDDRLFIFLTRLIDPYVIGFWALCKVLLERDDKLVRRTSRDIAKRAQDVAVQILPTGATARQCSSLSLELLTNGVYSLHKMGALRKHVDQEVSLFEVAHDELVLVARRLDAYTLWPSHGVDHGHSLHKSRAKL